MYVLLLLVALGSRGEYWDFSVDVDPITDDTVTLLSSHATSGSNRWGEKPFIGVRFNNGEDIDIFILWGVYVGSSNLSCIVRIDDAEAETYQVNPSTSNESTFFRGNDEQESLFQEMLNGSEMVCRFTPYGDNPITATFSLNGLVTTAIQAGINIEEYGLSESDYEIENSINLNFEDSMQSSGYIALQNGERIYIAEGTQIMFHNEVHTVLFVENTSSESTLISRVRLIPSDDLTEQSNHNGYWATSRQLENDGGIYELVQTSTSDENEMDGAPESTRPDTP